MRILRAVGGVVVGYVLFAAGSMVLIGPVMTRTGPVMIVVALLLLAVIGGLAGLLAGIIAGEQRRGVTYVLAGLVALATLANLFMGFGAEPVWYKIGTLVLTVPAILLLGLRGSSQ